MQNSRLPARGSLSPIQVHAAAREGKSGRAAARAVCAVCVCERVCAASLRTRVCIRGDVPLSLSGAAGRPEESAPERARLAHVPPPLRGAGCATASQGGRLGDSWSPKSGAPTLISRPGHTSGRGCRFAAPDFPLTWAPADSTRTDGAAAGTRPPPLGPP